VEPLLGHAIFLLKFTASKVVKFEDWWYLEKFFKASFLGTPL